MDTMEQNFSLICRKFTKFLNSELKNAGITPAELSYLSYLLEQNGMTQDELAKASCVDKAAVTRVIQTLEKKAWWSAGQTKRTSAPTGSTLPTRLITMQM